MAQVMFDRVQIDDFTVGGENLYGFYPQDAWTRLVGVMAAEGQIQRSDLELSKLFTNQFAREYNNFDRNAVIQAARAAK